MPVRYVSDPEVLLYADSVGDATTGLLRHGDRVDVDPMNTPRHGRLRVRHGSASGWIDADKIGESGVGLIASLRRSGVPIPDPADPGSDPADERASIRPKRETSPQQHGQSPSTPQDRLSMSDFPRPIRPSERIEYRRNTHFIPFSFIIAGLLWLLFVLPILAWHGEGVMIMGLLLIVPLIMLVVVLRSPVTRWLKYMADDEHAASIAKPPGGDSKQPRDADDDAHD